jgi:PIN domain nuclease of toxin-antitoxin system
MRLLLDTHVLLWAIAEPDRLSKRARRLLADESNDLVFSTASIWEIQLKRRAGRLTLPSQPGFLQLHILRLGVQEVLSITPEHAYRVLSLPAGHKDPFDCLLAAQCLAEDLPLVTSDPAFSTLGIRALW